MMWVAGAQENTVITLLWGITFMFPCPSVWTGPISPQGNFECTYVKRRTLTTTLSTKLSNSCLSNAKKRSYHAISIEKNDEWPFVNSSALTAGPLLKILQLVWWHPLTMQLLDDHATLTTICSRTQNSVCVRTYIALYKRVYLCTSKQIHHR